MKRIEFLKNSLSSLPLPEEGLKTIGVSTTGVISTIDSNGNIEPIGGAFLSNIDYKILFVSANLAEETFDKDTILSSITISPSLVSVSLSKNGGAFVSPTFPYSISINDVITYSVVYDNGKDKGTIIIKGTEL
jgi:hypothetical protein